MGIKKVYRLAAQATEVIVQMSCNCCGKDQKDRYDGGFHTIRLGGGYGDHFPGDCETFEFVVCEDCLKGWVGTFKEPDVSLGGWMSPKPVRVKHSDTEAPFIVSGWWAYPEGEECPTDDPPEDSETDNWPDAGVWQHFKGGVYEVLGYAHMRGTLEGLVVYRALHGESEVWLRPVVQWSEELKREGYSGPRFRKLLGD